MKLRDQVMKDLECITKEVDHDSESHSQERFVFKALD